VVDVADPAFRPQLAVAKEVIKEIGGEKIPGILIMNNRISSRKQRLKHYAVNSRMGSLSLHITLMILPY
jgi:50S ribosomal subunit-associated GTPase HflX